MQTTALQDQLTSQEWLAGRLERVAIALDGHHTTMEELLAALTSVGQGSEPGWARGWTLGLRRCSAGSGEGLG